MNLGQLELLLYDRLGHNSSPDPATTRRIRRYINETHRQVLGMRGFIRLRQAILPCAATANSPYMVLPQAAVNVSVITDRTNQRNLRPISLQDVRYQDPGQNFVASIPDSYAVLNFAEAVAVQPSAAASLFAISDSASDGSGVSVAIEGIVTGGYYRRASVTMNGLTAVNLSSVITTWEYVTKFYISATAAGNITLRQTSGVGTELARISPGRSYPRYTLVQLSPTPSTAIIYYCDCERHVDDMVSVNDEPLLDEDFHYILEAGVMRREYVKREKVALYKIEDMNYREGIAALRAFIARRGGVSVGGQRNNSGQGYSQLGSNYRAGS